MILFFLHFNGLQVRHVNVLRIGVWFSGSTQRLSEIPIHLPGSRKVASSEKEKKKRKEK